MGTVTIFKMVVIETGASIGTINEIIANITEIMIAAWVAVTIEIMTAAATMAIGTTTMVAVAEKVLEVSVKIRTTTVIITNIEMEEATRDRLQITTNQIITEIISTVEVVDDKDSQSPPLY